MSALAEFGQTREEATIEALEHNVTSLIKELAFVRDYRDACVLAENEACATLAEQHGDLLLALKIRARRSR